MLITTETADRPTIRQEYCITMGSYWYLFSYESFYISDVPLLIWHGKRYCSTDYTGTASSADTMDIVLSVVRKVVVYDKLYPKNINAPSGNVSCNQNTISARFKTG